MKDKFIRKKEKEISFFARAKVNLYLEVLKKMENGFHNIDSLVCFPDIGDHITFKKSKNLSLSISGDFSDKITKRSNDLVFISQWRKNNYFKIKMNLSIVLKVLNKFAIKSNLNFKILPSSFITSTEFEEEVKFYKNYFNEINKNYFLEKNNLYDSYNQLDVQIPSIQ